MPLRSADADDLVYVEDLHLAAPTLARSSGAAALDDAGRASCRAQPAPQGVEFLGEIFIVCRLQDIPDRVGCFSFYPTKNMTTGEGGMVTTDDDELAGRIRTLMAHGLSATTLERERLERPWLRAAMVPGYNFRLSNILAALGASQLSRLDDMNARRREHAARYSEELERFDELELPVEADGCRHVWQMYTVKLRGLDRTPFIRAPARGGRGGERALRRSCAPAALYAGLERARWTDLPVTERVASTIVTLPLWPGMVTDQRRHVVASVPAAVADRQTAARLSRSRTHRPRNREGVRPNLEHRRQ
jgi:DegT/DnrJ/EryC1/StrS aminotransferase family